MIAQTWRPASEANTDQALYLCFYAFTTEIFGEIKREYCSTLVFGRPSCMWGRWCIRTNENVVFPIMPCNCILYWYHTNIPNTDKDCVQKCLSHDQQTKYNYDIKTVLDQMQRIIEVMMQHLKRGHSTGGINLEFCIFALF